MFRNDTIFKTISEAAQDAIIMINTDGYVVYWNPAAENMFGYSPQEVMGKDVHLLLAPHIYHDRYNKGFNSFKHTGTGDAIGKTQEFSALKKDGTEIIIELSVSAIKFDDSWQAIAILRDITERKRTEIQLKEFQQHLQTVYDSIVDGLVILDLQTSIFVSVNPSFCKMFGYSREELLGKNISFLHPPEHLDRIYQEFQEKLEGKRIYSVDIPCLRKDRSIFYADVVDSKINYNNRPCVIAFFRDTTERRNSEKIKENFIATLSHDLRVPLLAENLTLKYLIKGSYGELGEKQLLAANNMLNSNKDLLNLVNTLLDVYKHEAQIITIEKEKLNIYNIVQECLSELQPLIHDHRKNITSYINENDFFVNADHKSIKRVFINLIGNAIDHTADNSLITIDASKDDSFITVKITDNGSGIPEHEVEKIFDLYYTSAKKLRKVGTGLGLYLSRQIVSAHGGKIWAESKLEKGSTFYFTLPLN